MSAISSSHPDRSLPMLWLEEFKNLSPIKGLEYILKLVFEKIGLSSSLKCFDKSETSGGYSVWITVERVVGYSEEKGGR